MAGANEGAEEFLERLAAAVFPDGARREQLTWPERAAGPPGSAEGETAQAEAKLRAAEARYRTLVEQIPAVTFMAVLGEPQGAERNEIYVSPHIEAVLGFTQEEWLGNPFLWYTQLHPDDRPLWNDEFARGCQRGGPFRAECRFIARDGRVVWVHGEARLVKDELGRPLFLQGVAFDITESKRAQEILVQSAVRAAKIEEEHAIARRVQTSIVPRHFDVPFFDVAAAMQPAEEVGGDYYDVLPSGDGCWLAIGDVSGHGLDAGLVMLMVQSGMSAAVRSMPEASPAEVLGVLNEVLYDNIRSRLRGDDHVTLSLLRCWRDGRVRIAGAHEDLLVCRRRTGKVESIRSTGTWLGAVRNIRAVTPDLDFRLEEGDVMVLYTDGITEAMDAKGEQWGIERFSAAIERMQDRTPTEILDHVLEEVRAWMKEQFDDISAVVLRYDARSAGP